MSSTNLNNQPEKTGKMYLLRAIVPHIFVSELQTTVTLRSIISTTIIILWQCTMTFDQQVWPGDVNNNGIVNNIDVLYWSVARAANEGEGATGPARIGATIDWLGQELLSVLWEGSFPGGLNFAYADCNGDGVVDDADKDVISNNYGRTHDTMIEDNIPVGDPLKDPILQLYAADTELEPGETLEAGLSLGSEDRPLENFYAIAFSVVYDTNFLRRGNPIMIDVPQESWISGQQGVDQPTVFFKNDRQNGKVDFTIYRKKGATKDGFGDIGEVSIVMEDIVLGYSTLGLNDILTIDPDLQSVPVAPSALVFKLGTVTPTREVIASEGLKVYPNPVGGDQVNLELENQQETIQLIEVYDTNGRRLLRQSTDLGTNRTSVDIGQYPAGIYTVKIISDRSVYVRGFFRK